MPSLFRRGVKVKAQIEWKNAGRLPASNRSEFGRLENQMRRASQRAW